MRQATLVLAVTLAMSVLGGACGGEAPAPQSPANAVPSPSGSAAPAAGATPAHGNGGVATLGTVPFTGAMKPTVASTMGAELTALGLDPKALPPIAQLDPGTLRKVMKTFTRALGAQCTDCHVENDYRAPTPRKNIAAKMWDHFARELAVQDGALLYCDSCHQGRMTPLLDRHDKKALSNWMIDNYVDNLKRKDGKEHSCETCHGDPFEGKFVTAWSSVNAAR